MCGTKEIKNYEEIAFKIIETDENGLKARKHQDQGNICTMNSEYEKAIVHYQTAREIYPELEIDKLEVIAYQWLAYNLLKRGKQYEKSIEYYTEAPKLALRLKDDETRLNIYLGLGIAFNRSGDIEFSKTYSTKAVALAEHRDDNILQMKAHTNLGNAYYKSREFEAAVKSFNKVEKILQDLHQGKQEVGVGK